MKKSLILSVMRWTSMNLGRRKEYRNTSSSIVYIYESATGIDELGLSLNNGV